MFKIANVSEELASEMEKYQAEAFSDQTENQYKLAIAYLMDAAEYFDLAGMEKEAHITSLILQKFAAPPEEIITPQIIHDVFDPQRNYDPHKSGPKKIYEVDELIPEEKIKSNYVDPTPAVEPTELPFQLKEEKERFEKPSITKDEAYKLLRKHERMSRFLTGKLQDDARNEYIATILYLKSVLDGRPNPDIYIQYKQKHAPQWAADIIFK